MLWWGYRHRKPVKNVVVGWAGLATDRLDTVVEPTNRFAPRMAIHLVLVEVEGLVGGLEVDVGLVDVGTARLEGELVEEEPEEADDAETEHGPRETDNGGDARALVNEGLVLERERVDGVAALKTVAEGGSGEDTRDGTEHDTSGEEAEEDEGVAQGPVAETEDQVEDGGEESKTESVVEHAVGVRGPVVAILVDLLRDETQEGEVDSAEEGEEGHEEGLAGGRERETQAGGGGGLLLCGQVSFDSQVQVPQWREYSPV